MKRMTFIIFLLAVFLSPVVQGQDTLRLFGHQKERGSNQKKQRSGDRPSSDIQTLTGPGHKVGFYFGFHTGYSRIADYDAFSAGVNLTMIANHGLAIGFAGRGFFTETFDEKDGSGSLANYSYDGGYGGILIEPIILPKFPVHVSFPVILGAGGIAKNRLNNFEYPYDYTDVYTEDSEAFLIAEPGVEIEFNVTRWMRLAIGGSYRFTTSIEPSDFKSDPLNGFTGGLSVKFGMF
ncbi:MAG: hypothetical protein V1775_06815 [Bacteroidota bacterium]